MKQLPLAPQSPNERALAQVYAETITGVTGLKATLAYTPVTTVNGVGLEQLFKNGTLMGASGAAGGATQIREVREDLSGGVTGITRVGGTAFVDISPSVHFFATGDTVNIANADQAAYNGDFTITVTGPSTWSYGVGGAPVTPATGSITYGALSFSLLKTPTSDPELLFRGGALVRSDGGAAGYTRTGSRIALGVAATSTSHMTIWYKTGGGGYSIVGQVITFDVALVSTDVLVAHYSYRN